MDRIGRYKIVRELGRGAMGVVYHAIDPNIGRPVAIKTIPLGAGRKPEEQERMRERLFREARSAGILSHPGIVTIYDVEQQGDLAYIAMEYVDGPTLDQLLSSPEPVSAEQIFGILGQTSAALDYAHQKGIVHRDIKPANIMIAGDGTAKITDFGIAKITASEQLTMTGSIVGTPHYMSPEQVQGQPVDGRSDQFSLAVIAYEMLTGEKPYTGEHLTTVVYKIVAEEPAPPHRINSTLSLAIEGALRKAMAKKPDSRYATCQEFAEALEKACAATKGWKSMPRGGSLNEPTLADVGRPPVTLPPARRVHSGDTTATAARTEKKSGFLPFLAAILMAAALLALIGWQAAPQWFSSNRTSQETPAASTQPPAQPSGPADDKPHPMPPVEKSTSPPAEADSQNPQTQPAAGSPDEKRAQKPAGESTAKASPAEPKTEEPKPAPPKEAASTELPTRAPAGRDQPVRRQVARMTPGPQQVTVISNPAGATATLDGHADTACTTPCSLEATPGQHNVAVTLPGYQVEHREVYVESSSQEIPAVILHALAGTLFLTSEPAGADILVNGKSISQKTPAQLQLPFGTYKITVDLGGKQATRDVTIRNGINQQKIFLGQ